MSLQVSTHYGINGIAFNRIAFNKPAFNKTASIELHQSNCIHLK